MRLGFYTNYTKEIAAFAHRTGFKSLQLSAWPKSSLDADSITDDRIDEIRADLQAKDIAISALGFYPNYLDPDPAESAEAARYLRKVLELAQRMGVGVVATFAGRNPDRTVEANLPAFADLFTDLCAEAEDRGVRIAIENCPMVNRKSVKGINIAYSPEIWDAMFEAVRSPALGLELDPSHMVWQGIDYVRAVYDYGDRIFHVHAKDMELRRDVLERTGIYGQAFGDVYGLGHGWWRARTPGWGEVNWPRFITALVEVGYDGNIDIEHEDDVFAKPVEDESDEAGIVHSYGQEERGLVLGFNTLSRFIA